MFDPTAAFVQSCHETDAMVRAMIDLIDRVAALEREVGKLRRERLTRVLQGDA